MLLVLPSSLLVTDVIVGQQVLFVSIVNDLDDDNNNIDKDNNNNDGNNNNNNNNNLGDDDSDDDTQQSEQLTLEGEDYSGDYLDYLLAY